MNYNKEPYPTSIDALTEEAKRLAVDVKLKLNASSCPRIDDLYTKTSEKGSVVRQVKKFDALDIESNSHLGKPKIYKNGDQQKPNELKGLYIMGEHQDGEVTPVYVGISRTIYRRIRQHGWGKNHNECTLAYLKTRERLKKQNNSTSRSSIATEEMEPARKKIRQYKITFIPVTNDFDLYFLEVALAGILKTKWNSFKTH